MDNDSTDGVDGVDGVEGVDGVDDDDDDDDGDKAGFRLLNCEQCRNSGHEVLNIWRKGSQPSLAASQNDAQGCTTRLHTHTYRKIHTREGVHYKQQQ